MGEPAAASGERRRNPPLLPSRGAGVRARAHCSLSAMHRLWEGSGRVGAALQSPAPAARGPGHLASSKATKPLGELLGAREGVPHPCEKSDSSSHCCWSSRSFLN